MAGYNSNKGKLDANVQARMADLVRAGVPVTRAAAFCQIAASTVKGWMYRGRQASESRGGGLKVKRSDRRYERFYEKMQESLAACQVRLVMKMQERAEDGDMGAIRYILSRRFREDWGEQTTVELTGAGGGPVQMEDVGQSLTVEDLTEVGRILAANGVLSVAGPDDVIH